ncbi:alpha/beta hydrolase [Pantanalinema sp. GBBB05]|uniref:alpha/beta hydrolase n=1 Tax=Pantanalinema sp. GBBB05 TaxID=2604139 RepID=UPI001D4BA489|nr:esterase family protein [Pantanalinema sp. GBBB05]
MKLKRLFLIFAIALIIVTGAGSWYVFVAGAPQFDSPQAERNTGLTFQVKTFNSVAMVGERRYGVVLPHDYAKQPHQRYPVLFLLHGGHGNERDFEDKAKLTSVLHDLYQRKQLPPSIVITPDGNDNRGSSPFWDSDYYDGPNGKVATLIGSELVQVVKSRYRTLNQPQFWAMGGISSGGWGALNIGLRYINQFRTFFSHTGYFTDISGMANSPKTFIQQIPVSAGKGLRIYLDAGEDDHQYLDATQAFHQTLNQLGIFNEFHVFPGGHGIVGPNVGWNYWHQHLADSLAFVGKQFKLALKQSQLDSIKKQQETQNGATNVTQSFSKKH